MKKKIKKETRGGFQPGAGRKSAKALGVEKKESVTVRMYPSEKKMLIAKYGGLQAAVDSLSK